jgi:hypothetical protein
MRSGVIALCISCIFPTATQPYRIPSQSMWKSNLVVIAASEILDGKGGMLHDTRIVIDGSKIVAIDPKAGPVDYDLRGLTVLPGWIDAHVHATWSFGPDGKNVGAGGTSQEAAWRDSFLCWPLAFIPSLKNRIVMLTGIRGSLMVLSATITLGLLQSCPSTGKNAERRAPSRLERGTSTGSRLTLTGAR